MTQPHLVHPLSGPQPDSILWLTRSLHSCKPFRYSHLCHVIPFSIGVLPSVTIWGPPSSDLTSCSPLISLCHRDFGLLTSFPQGIHAFFPSLSPFHHGLSFRDSHSSGPSSAHSTMGGGSKNQTASTNLRKSSKATANDASFPSCLWCFKWICDAFHYSSLHPVFLLFLFPRDYVDDSLS